MCGIQYIAHIFLDEHHSSWQLEKVTVFKGFPVPNLAGSQPGKTAGGL